MQVPTPEQVCKVLEWHSLHLEELRYKDYSKAALIKFNAKVYEYTHISRNPSCIEKHAEWVEEFWKDWNLLS